MSDLRNEAKAIVRSMMVRYNTKCLRVYSEKRKTTGETNIDGRTLKFYSVMGKGKNIKRVIRKSNKQLKRLGMFVEIRKGEESGRNRYAPESIHVLQINP